MEIIKNGITYKLSFPDVDAKELKATEEDLLIFEHIHALCPDVELVRRADAYLTAALGLFDVVRFKYTDRAKWLNISMIDTGKVKRRFEEIDDLKQFDDDIIKSYEIAKNGGYMTK